MHLRMSATQTNKMPPLARNLVDTNAVSLVAQWINTIVPTPPLPSPWEHDDIGHVGLKGSAIFQGDTFTVGAAGTDIWGLADEFHYVYQPMNGDGEMLARVVRMRHSDEWAKAGVMIRESLDPGSRYAHMFASSDFGPAFEYRLGTDERCWGGATNIVMNPPYWVKLTRKGTMFTGSYSKEGKAWKEFGSNNITMGQKVYVGLAVTSHNNGAINQSIFDHVKLQNPAATIIKND
jgi:regulation of enolase protein 1 (concanavalin A-like superfamily)